MNHHRHTAHRLVLALAIVIVATEAGVILWHRESAAEFVTHYLWAAPIVLFKSFVKKFLLLNVLGLLKVLLSLFWHVFKFFLIKGFKTVGVRYGAYFTTQKWHHTTLRIARSVKYITDKHEQFKRFLAGFDRASYWVVVLAFFPLFLLLFLSGVSYRLTKKSFVSDDAPDPSPSQTKKGLVAWLERCDAWILTRINALSRSETIGN